jgi:Major Facilitator Superfamily
VCGLSPTRSALLIAPMAVCNGVFAPFVGRIVDRYHPLPVLGFGFSVLATSLTWLSFEMSPGTPIWRLVLPFAAVGLGMAFVWSPLTATATRNLPPHLAGAGSAVYNSVRQLGAVLGSAGMAAFMTYRIGAELPPRPPAAGDGTVSLELPDFLAEPFSAAMSQSVLLPAFVGLFGIVAALFLVGFARPAKAGDAPGYGERVDDCEDYDDDDYVEFLLLREPDTEPPPTRDARRATAPADNRPRRPVPAPTDTRHREPGDPRRGPRPRPAPRPQPIGFAHNGSRVDTGRRLRPVGEASTRASRPGSPGDRPPQRHHNGAARQGPAAEGEAPRSQHYRPDPDDDPQSYGRHSSGR